MAVYYVVFLLFVFLVTQCTSAVKYEEVNSETCENEKFQARCSYSQNIFITQATYGHIKISRCVGVDFGYFGCTSDVKDLISQRCNGKSRCEIETPDTEIEATKSCVAGLEMYLDITYVCIPKTLPHVSCSSDITATNNRQYITSEQVLTSGCGATIKVRQNMKVKFTLAKIASANTNDTAIGNLHSKEGEEMSIRFAGDQDEIELVTSYSEVTVELSDNLKDIVLIGFQATGCEDLAAPPYAFIEREGDRATLTCEYSDYTWQLSCVGTKWIGGMGNCTKQVQKEVIEIYPEEEKELPALNAEEDVFSSEILFALIIGITLFLCAVVITTGWVCLRRAKYASRTSQKEKIELNSVILEGDGTSSWRKKTFNRNELNVNGENQPLSWQQTLPQSLTNQVNGTLPSNTQKYFILDRDA